MAVQKTNSRTPTRKKGSKVDFMKATNSIGKPIATIAGFAIGKLTLNKLQKNETISGLVGTDMKQYIVPAVVTMGGLVGTQFTKNEYLRLGLVGLAGAGVEAAIKKATGKTILQGLEGLMGDEDSQTMEALRLNPITQGLPSADIDIEREIQASISGASDFSMSDEPIGSRESNYNDESMIRSNPVGAITNIDPDSMDFDIFSGDMMES